MSIDVNCDVLWSCKWPNVVREFNPHRKIEKSWFRIRNWKKVRHVFRNITTCKRRIQFVCKHHSFTLQVSTFLCQFITLPLQSLDFVKAILGRFLGKLITSLLNFRKMFSSSTYIVSAVALLSTLILTTDALRINRVKTRSVLALRSTIAPSPTTTKIDPILGTFNYLTDKKLPWVPTGYKTWEFQGHKVNYIDVGNDSDVKKPPLLLIHGFGASIYHWRYNIPILARDYHVYAIDLLGFGLSDKPIIDYSAELWRDQALAFIKEVVSRHHGC